MGLICASVPALRPLFKKLVGSGLHSSNNGYEMEKNSGSAGFSGKMPSPNVSNICASNSYSTRIFSKGAPKGAVLSSGNESEEQIVPSAVDHGKVEKNIEYTVEYSRG